MGPKTEQRSEERSEECECSTIEQRILYSHASTNQSEGCTIADEDPVKKEQVKKNRCWCCNKKVGLLGYDCRCGYVYCATHRYAEDHECDYNFKEAGRSMLTEQNPVVNGCKLIQI